MILGERVSLSCMVHHRFPMSENQSVMTVHTERLKKTHQNLHMALVLLSLLLYCKQ